MPTLNRDSIGEPVDNVDPETLHYVGSPKDWPAKKKWLHILIVASMTMATPLASSIHAPALPLVADEFSVARSIASLTVPAYVVGFATGPFLFLPLSKVYGRLPIYKAANVLLLCGNLGCAAAPGLGWLLVFRFLAGCAGGCAITQSSGTIADIIEKEKRGRAVAVMAFGTVWAPILGPAIGGRIAEKFGWRGCFWVLVSVVAFNTIVTILYMEETSTTHTAYAYSRIPATELKSPLLSTSAEEGDHVLFHSEPNPLGQIMLKAICGPFRLMRHPIFCTLSLISALFYSIQIFSYVDIPATYKDEYSFTPSQTGLAFLGTGVGMTTGLVAFGIASDRVMISLAGTGPRKPEYRLPLMVVSALLVSCGLAVYIITARPTINWIIPIIGNGLTGAGLYSLSMTISLYLIDLSPERAVDSATLLSMVRFPFGAFVSAFSEKVAPVIGRTSIKVMFAIVALHAVPIIYLLYRNGEKIREKYRTRPS